MFKKARKRYTVITAQSCDLQSYQNTITSATTQYSGSSLEAGK